MKEAIIIIALFATFAFGFFVVSRADKLIERDKKLAARRRLQSKTKIRIGAESSALANSVAYALKSVALSAPQTDVISFFGEANRIAERLCENTVDIAILSRQNAVASNKDFAYVAAGENVVICWNKTVKSAERDRVIFLLQEAFAFK